LFIAFATIFNFSLSRNPTHGDSEDGEADPHHLDAEVGKFVSFEGLRFHVATFLAILP